MEPQVIFDRVTKHLLAQNERSQLKDPEGLQITCAYRGVDGLMCAVGCLIPDDLYRVEMENKNIAALLSFPTMSNLLGASNIDLLQGLQRIHDKTAPFLWKHELNQLARREGLTYNGGQDNE